VPRLHHVPLLFPVLYLHVLLFGDGMQLWKLRQQGFEVITSTLGEFDEGLRSSTKSPAIQLNFMASKKNQVEGFGGSYDRILELFVAEFVELAGGVAYWCEHLKAVVTVVAVFHGFEGDMPGRYKAGGCRSPLSDGEICPVCPETKVSLLQAVGDGTRIEPRPPGFYTHLVQKHNGGSSYDEAILTQHGLSRISCKNFLQRKKASLKPLNSFLHPSFLLSALWQFPGAMLQKQLLLEWMHLQAEGELVKHFTRFSRVLEQYRVSTLCWLCVFSPPFLSVFSCFPVSNQPNFWADLQVATKNYFLEVMGTPFQDVSSWRSWSSGLNAADRLKFCLHSVSILKSLIPEEQKLTGWAGWKAHIRLIKLGNAHAIAHDDLAKLHDLVISTNQWMLCLYGPEVVTPNTQWTNHIAEYISWFSTLRGYWTFPQESILSLIKKATRKMTNHRAVAFSCTRIFVLERLLNQVLCPFDDIPKR